MRPDVRMCLLLGEACSCMPHAGLTAVGFESTQLALVELESTPLRPLGQTVVGSWLGIKILRAGSACAHAALRKWNLSPPPWTTWARCRGFLAESQDSPRRQRLTPWQPDVCMCLQLREACGCMPQAGLTAVGFEPTQLALVELESTPLDHSGKLS